MVADLQPSRLEWKHTAQGALRHVSRLTFAVDEVRSRGDGPAVITLTVDRNTLEPWQENTLLQGTAMNNLGARLQEIEAQGAAWYRSQLRRVA